LPGVKREEAFGGLHRAGVRRRRFEFARAEEGDAPRRRIESNAVVPNDCVSDDGFLAGGRFGRRNDLHFGVADYDAAEPHLCQPATAARPNRSAKAAASHRRACVAQRGARLGKEPLRELNGFVLAGVDHRRQARLANLQPNERPPLRLRIRHR
jgi:hypothetical protein